METSAFKGLPLAGLARQGAPAAGQDSGAAGLLSGEQFLQMLLGLATDAPALPGAALAEDTQDTSGSEATEDKSAMDGSWLPLASFIASAMKVAPDAAADTPAAAAIDPAAASTSIPASNPASVAVGADRAPLPSPLQASGAAKEADPVVAATTTAEAADIADAGDVAGAVKAVLDAGNLPSPAGGERASAPTSFAGIQVLAAGTALAPDRAPLAGAMAQPSFEQHVRAPLHSARWAQEVGQRVALMAVNGRTSGSLSLTPEQMGPIEVRIHMNQDRADVWFGATQADTRAALQDALPRLREMFSANGLALGEAQVSQQAPRREGESSSAPARSAYAGEDDAPVSALAPQRPVSLGLVDTYA